MARKLELAAEDGALRVGMRQSQDPDTKPRQLNSVKTLGIVSTPGKFEEFSHQVYFPGTEFALFSRGKPACMIVGRPEEKGWIIFQQSNGSSSRPI
jgi:hypothetical protein